MGIWNLPDQTIQYKSDGVMQMEVDGVADMVVKIPNEDFADVTLAIGEMTDQSRPPDR